MAGSVQRPDRFLVPVTVFRPADEPDLLGEGGERTSIDDSVRVAVVDDHHCIVEELPRTMKLLNFIAVAFMLVCGGPFGVEDAVAQGGALFTLSALLILPFVWALPQALMAAELSTLMPYNGGSVVWVKQTFGDATAWMYSYNAIVSNVFDIALFPVLLVEYMRPFCIDWFTPSIEVTLKAGFVAISTALNLIGIESLSRVELFLTLCMFVPFVVELAVLISQNKASISTLVKSEPLHDIDFGVFSSTLLWLFTGWISLGTLGGEIKRPEKTFPRGVVITIFLATVNFIVPVIAGLWAQPDTQKWDTGGFASIAFDLATPLGWAVLAASVISNFGQLNADIACCARMQWAMGFHPRQLPKVFSFTWRRFETPAAAVLINSAVVMILVSLFPFTFLVQVDMVFNNLCLLAEFGVFMYLKYKDARPRPYAVPLGKLGAWIITVPKIIVIVGTLATAMWQVGAAAVVANIFFALAYRLSKLWGRAGLRPADESARLLLAA